MIGSKDIFERLEKYDSKLTHSMYELFIAKQQASVNLLQAQTEAVKSLPKASEREYIITTRGQWFWPMLYYCWLGCFCLYGVEWIYKNRWGDCYGSVSP